MQSVIVYIIVAFVGVGAVFYLLRSLRALRKKKESEECSSCEGCPSKGGCSAEKSLPPKEER